MRRWLLEKLKKWFLPPSTGVHFDCADGLRGLAVLMVVVGHGFYLNPKGPKFYLFLGKFIGLGALGVPIFFALSAFLLSQPFLRARAQNPRAWYTRGFALRRVSKILPPFYLVSLLLALFLFWKTADSNVFARGFMWAVGVGHFVQSWEPLNGSFWSLWVEIGFYATLPFLFLASRGRPARTAVWVAFALLLIVPFLSRLITWSDSSPLPERFFIDRRFPNSLDYFAWGILFSALYVALSREPHRWRHLARLGYLGAALLVASGFTGQYLGQMSPVPRRLDMEVSHFLFGLSACLILFFIFDSSCLGTRLLSSPVMRFFGMISYEWFLLHQPIQWEFRAWMQSSHGSLPRYLFTVLTSTLLSLGAAILIYHNFSLPILRWGRKWATSSRAPTPQPDVKEKQVSIV